LQWSPARADSIENVPRTFSLHNSVIPTGASDSRGESVCGVEGPAFMREHIYTVYMIASRSRVPYIGMRNNPHRRVWEHKNDLIDGFTKEYKCHRLVYYESFDDVANAIDREKQLKHWNRTKKEWLIKQHNPTWEDLAAEWYLRHNTNQKSRSLHAPDDWLSESSDLVGMTELEK
jgi:putative endonuclease